MTAHRWWKNGDHPGDYAKPVEGFSGGELVQVSAEEQRATDWEGQVVRRYRKPGIDGADGCRDCGYALTDHGWIDSGGDGQLVHPGDWIITGAEGNYYASRTEPTVTPITPDFAARFEALVLRELALGPIARRLRFIGYAILVSLVAAGVVGISFEKRGPATVIFGATLLLAWHWITLSQRELREGFELVRERTRLLREMLDYARVPEQPPGELHPGDKFKGPPAGSI